MQTLEVCIVIPICLEKMSPSNIGIVEYARFGSLHCISRFFGKKTRHLKTDITICVIFWSNQFLLTFNPQELDSFSSLQSEYQTLYL